MDERISFLRSKSTKKMLKNILKNYQLYILLIPALAYIIIFHYGPMYGVQLAFKNFVATKGITNSPWVGLKHFNRFFSSANFLLVIRNTITINLYSLCINFPIPIIFALMLNNVTHKRFKSFVQTVTYAPHFISTVVLVSMMLVFLSPRSGFINIILKNYLGIEPIFFMAKNELFKSIYVFSGLWQNMGWAAIIYIAALTGIDRELHEAAVVDGANKIQRIIHIDIPGIMPTMVTLFILNMGSIMNVGFEKVFLMQNSLNLEASETISTYVYKVGLVGADFSYSTAVGLFNSVINFLMLLIANSVSKKVTEVGLF